MNQIRIQRTLNAPVAKVFEAWSNPEAMSRWFFPGQMSCEVQNDFRVGGAYRLKMKGEENDYLHTGEYREIVKDKKIAFTWSSHIVSDTLVTVELAASGAGTALTLTHDLIKTEEALQQHMGGWNGCLDNLTAYLD